MIDRDALALLVAKRRHTQLREQHPKMKPWDDMSDAGKQEAALNFRAIVDHVLTELEDQQILVAQSWPLQDDEVAVNLVAAPQDGEGRSEWRWLRTSDGDLMLGLFPQSATYELLSEGPAADDYEAAEQADTLSLHNVRFGG